MKKILCFILVIIFNSLAYITASDLPYTFRGLTMSEGLADLLVNTIYKDKSGVVWFGTSNSVDRFDGIEFRHYKFNHTDNKMKRVNAIAETADSRIWVGNNMGLWVLDNSTDALFPIGVDKIDFPVYSLLYDGKQKLYIGTEKGFFIFTNKALECQLVDKNELSPSNHIRGMAIDSKGTLWLVTPVGLYSYNTSTKKIESHNQKAKFSGFRNIVCIGNRIFIGTDNSGLIEYNKNTGNYSPYLRLGCNIVSSLSSNDKDMLYVGTDGAGAYFISTRTNSIVRNFHHDVNDDSNIRSNSVYSLLVDRDGIVWIGFYQAGVDYSLYQSGLFDTYSCGDFSTKNFVIRSFAFAGNYKVLGTRDGLFLVDEKKKQVSSFDSSHISSNLIFSVCYYNKEFYVGTYGGGLWVLNPETKSIKQFNSKFKGLSSGGSVFSICKEGGDKLWFATSFGVYCYNSSLNKIDEYTNRNSQLPEGQVYSIFFDSYKRGWIGTENGLALFEPSSRTIRTNVFPEGFAKYETIRSIYEDSHHRLYFLPDKGPIFVSSIDMKNFSNIPLNPAARSTSFMSVIEDRNGHLWLGCDNGLLKNRPGDEDYSIYGFNDGIQSPVFSYAASLIDDNGYLWFGTAKGLIKLNKEKLEKVNRNPYQISITDIYANGKPLTAEMRKGNMRNGYYTFLSSQRNLEFHFSYKNYTNPYSMGFEYKLDGIDKEWKIVFGTNVASYFDLPAGDYVFHVRVLGDAKNERSVHIKIESDSKAWIGGLILVLILILILLVYKKRYKKVPSSIAAADSDKDSLSVGGNESINMEYPKAVTADKYKTIKLSVEECELLVAKLNTLMEKDHLYENPELKIGDLAKALDVSSPSLSYLFNLHLHHSYYDYINDYRIKRFKQIAKEGGFSRYTLDAMAEKCGFSSRASFFRSFKKSTGITPNEYLNSIK